MTDSAVSLEVTGWCLEALVGGEKHETESSFRSWIDSEKR